MQQNLHYKGIWFLPGNPNEKIAGDLSFSVSDGVELNLLGVFSDSLGHRHEPTFILGISADGHKITIYGAMRISQQFNSNSFMTSSYAATYMFVGKHFSLADEMHFSSMRVSLADFDYWLGIYGFTKLENNAHLTKTMLEYNQPDDLCFKINEKLNCNIKFSSSVPIVKSSATISIKQEAEVELKSIDGKVSFSQFMEWFGIFHRFMTLAYFGEPAIASLSVHNFWQNNGGENQFYNVKVFYQYPQSEIIKKRNSKHYFLFTYKDVNQNFEQILQQWFKMDEAINPVTSGLTESLMRKDYAIEYKFLNLAHSIETLHRRTRKNEVLSSELYKEKVKTIISTVHPEYTEWLKEKLTYGNELSLHERMTDLMSLIPEAIRTVVIKPNVEEFIRNFKNSRNYYTHYDKRLEKKALKAGELFKLSEMLKIFLVCLTLKETGFSDDEIVKIIFGKGVWLFNHVISYDEAAKHFTDW